MSFCLQQQQGNDGDGSAQGPLTTGDGDNEAGDEEAGDEEVASEDDDNDDDFEPASEEEIDDDVMEGIENEVLEVNDQQHYIMFNIPLSLLERLPPDVAAMVGVRFGLKRITMSLPRYTPIRRLGPNDILNRHTDYIQIYLNESSTSINLMNHYMYVTGKILSMLWHYAKQPGEETFTHTLLELPNFQFLATISDQRKKRMLNELCRIASNVYDFEWWWIVNQKSKKCAANNPDNTRVFNMGGAHKFPTTLKELAAFVQNKPYIKINPGRPQMIKSLGKFSKTEFANPSKVD